MSATRIRGDTGIRDEDTERNGLARACRLASIVALARELGPRRGLHFRTPAAIEVDRPLMRAQMNMRPLGVWMLAWGQDYRNG